MGGWFAGAGFQLGNLFFCNLQFNFLTDAHEPSNSLRATVPLPPALMLFVRCDVALCEPDL